MCIYGAYYDIRLLVAQVIEGWNRTKYKGQITLNQSQKDIVLIWHHQADSLVNSPHMWAIIKCQAYTTVQLYIVRVMTWHWMGSNTSTYFRKGVKQIYRTYQS